MSVNSEFIIRLAEEKDAESIFQLANEKSVRESSLNTAPISWDNHIKWFSQKLKDDKCFFYIAEDAMMARTSSSPVSASSVSTSSISTSPISNPSPSQKQSYQCEQSHQSHQSHRSRLAGQLRVDRRENESSTFGLISISVAESWRGKGVAKSLLKKAQELRHSGFSVLHAVVKKENTASAKLFEACQFSLHSEDEGQFLYTYSLPE